MKSKFYYLLSVLFLLSFTTHLFGQNTIALTNPPMDLSPGDPVEVTVNFTTSEPSAYILVRLIDPNGENPQAFTEKSGSGSHTFTIDVPETSGSGYRWQAQLLRKSDWGGLANEFVDGVSVGGGGAPPSTGNNTISFSNPPTDLTADEPVNVSVNYATSEPSAYILVRLINPNGENPQAFTEISSSGSHTFTIDVPGTSGSGYRWQAQLMRKSDWGGLDNQFVDNVSVGGSTPDPDPDPTPVEGEDSIALTSNPDIISQGESYDITFNYNFTGERFVQAYITNKSTEANGQWVKIAQALPEFQPGNGSGTIPLEVTGEPLESNLLVVQVFDVSTTNGEQQWILVDEQQVDGIGFSDGYGFGERNTTPNGAAEYMRYYNRDMQGQLYNGNDVGNGSGVDHTLAPTSQGYRSNWWVNASWVGPIKSHYGERNLNGKDFWVEWQNLGTIGDGHAEFDIRVEKSDKSVNGAALGFPSKIQDLNGPLEASFTGRWTAGSTGRGHINMTAWIHGRDPSGKDIRSDIIIHGWDNSGDLRSNYERSFRWEPSYSENIFYFDKIGTATDGNVTYDVLRTMPGGYGESASYNLIPTNWRRNHITVFPTAPFDVKIDVAEIIREVIRREEENGADTRKLQNSSVDIPVYTIKNDWELMVMEWTITGQSGSYKHDPSSPDPDVNVYVPNSKGRFTFDEYSIANPCSVNPTINCPSGALKAQLAPQDSLAVTTEFDEMAVSPNPFKNSFGYEYSVENEGPVTVDLLDINGRIVKTVHREKRHRSGNYKDAIDTGTLDAGVYLLRITSSDGEKTMKIIKD